MRLEYQLPVTADDIPITQTKVGKFRKDGRAELRGTLHRLSAEQAERELIDKITVRVARAIPGVAELLRSRIEQANGLAIIDLPAVETTLLRGVTRIRAEVLGLG